jgi:hypothetical protein
MEHDIYLITAIVGCTLLALQVILQLVGVIGDMDVDHGGDVDVHADFDHGGDVHDSHFDHAGEAGHGDLFFGVLSFKALTAFVGIFGLVGLSLEASDLGFPARVGIAGGAGLLAMFGVGRLMFFLAQMQASGTVDLRNAVGRAGTVYLRIPEAGEGRGKVTVEVQGRSVELTAVSDGPALKTGDAVRVISVEGDVARVVPA